MALLTENLTTEWQLLERQYYAKKIFRVSIRRIRHFPKYYENILYNRKV